MKAIIIDTNALLFRVYHALPRLTDSQGRPIQAVYGLTNILLRIIQDFQPDYLFSCWDRPEPTFRHKAYQDYKAQRPPISDDFKIQIPLAKKIMQAFQIPVLEVPGYEADDLIATLKEILSPKMDEIIILTGDLDVLQLVDKKTKIYTMKRGIREMKFYDEAEVKNRYGIAPEQIVDFKSLVGDSSDNIKGILGIGQKTASKLLQKYHNLENIIQAAENNSLDPKFTKIILQEKERLLFQKNLLILKKDIPLEVTLQKYPGPNYSQLKNLFQEFGFRSLLKKIETLTKTKSTDLFSEDFQRKIFSVLENQTIANIKIKNAEKIFIFYLPEKSKIFIVARDQIFVLPKEEVRQIFFLEGKKYFWDSKLLWKEVLLSDWYLDQKIDLQNIFDLKILFWLSEPNLGRYSFKDAISFIIPKLPLNLTLTEYFPYWEEFREKIENKLDQLNLWKVYREIEVLLTPVLARMELSGIKINRSKLKEIKRKCLEEVQKLRKKIQILAGMPFNPLSTKELRYVLFEKLKLPTKGLSKTSKGEISTQESELYKIIQNHPIVEKILDYRKLAKIASTYTDSLLVSFDAMDGRVHPTYNQTGTSTGRLSSENPNVQNIPLRGDLANLVRQSFIPEHGFFFLASDYSQLELRLAAHLSDDDNLINAFQNDLDIHSQTAKLLFGKETPETRRIAKAVNFGIIYGMQAKGLADRLRITVSEAQDIIKKYFYFYPGLEKLRLDLIEKAKSYGYAETLFGRKLLLSEIYSRSYREKSFAERVAINMPIQGLGADIIKKAMIEIDRAFFEYNFVKSARLLLSIHDELIFEVKEELLDPVSKIVKQKMEKVISLKVPLKVKIKEGRDLQEIKD